MQEEFKDDELLHHIALTCVPHLGDIHIHVLLKNFGSASNVFSAQKRSLECLPGIGSVRAGAIKAFKNFSGIEKELTRCHQTNTRVLIRGKNGYPSRLNHCPDAPAILYFSGNASPDMAKVVSIVGTRSPTQYGKDRVLELLEALARFKVLVVSGLAYGVDTLVHREALKHGLPTIGVLGHGLDKLYPFANRQLADEMLMNGGMLTEFMRGTKPDRQNFPRRNRIVAGMADAVIVIESGEKGGSLITAELANGYNKDVLAYPGRAIDEQSMGCNALIAGHKANLVTSGQQVIDFLNWSTHQQQIQPKQMALFSTLAPEEQQLIKIIELNQPVSIDSLAQMAAQQSSKVSALLLSLEMQGIVALLPGKLYALCR
jgi:DNA processing protein